MQSRALSKSLNSHPLSLSFGLKLSCTLNSHALSKSLDCRPLSLSFGLKVSFALINSHALSKEFKLVNSCQSRLASNSQSCTLINSHTLSKEFELSLTLVLILSHLTLSHVLSSTLMRPQEFELSSLSLSFGLQLCTYGHYSIPFVFLSVLDKVSLLTISRCTRWLKSIFHWNTGKKLSLQYKQGTKLY